MSPPWRPGLTRADAVQICGGLSSPGKMPCQGYALPASACRLGSFLQQIPRAICNRCYALRGRYLFPVVQNAMARRLSSLTDPLWVEAISTLIRFSGDRYFRWNDSGDLQGIEHLEKIVQVCKNLPLVKFWLPTREYYTVERFRRIGGQLPSNLCIRLSAHLIDGKPPVGYGLPASVVVSGDNRSPRRVFGCTAYQRGNRCGSCRACWNPAVKVVAYRLKWASNSGVRLR
jgi:hypothetical protein